MATILSATKPFQNIDVVRLKSEIESSNFKVVGITSQNNYVQVEVFLLSGSDTLSSAQIDAVQNIISAHSFKKFVDEVSIEDVLNGFTAGLNPVSGTLTLDLSSSKVFLGALSSSVTTWDIINAPIQNGKAVSLTLVISGNSARTYGDACSINGVSVSGGVIWSGGSAPVATNNTDIITFIIIKDTAGAIKVFGNSTLNLS